MIIFTMLLGLAACSSKEPEVVTTEAATEAVTETAAPETTEPETEAAAAKAVGIVLHSEDTGRWHFMGGYLKARLEAAGHIVTLAYADDAAGQTAAIAGIQADLLIAAPVQGLSLENVQAPVISCDGQAGDYQVGFSSYQAGVLQAQYLIDKLNLENAGSKQFTLELVGSNPGAMETLKPYLDAGTLVIPSGKPESTLEEFQTALTSQYAEGTTLDAVLCTEAAADVIAAVKSGYAGDNAVLIAGQGADADVESIVDGSLSVTIYGNPADEANAVLALANALLAGENADAAVQLTPWVIDRDSLNMLVEAGSYAWDADGRLNPAG